MKRFGLALLLLLVCGVIATQAAEPQKVFRATVDKDGVQRVSVVGGEYFFDPGHIIVKVNQPVELTYSKRPGMTPHNIVIKAFTAGIDFDESMTTEPKVIRFTPKKTGTYPIYCSKKLPFLKSHRDRGMEGVLEVVE